MKSTLFYLEQQDYCLIDRGQLDLRRKSVRKCSPFSTDFWNCLRLSVRCSGCHLSLQCFRHPLLLLVLEGPRLHPAYSSFKLAFPFSVYASWNLPTLWFVLGGFLDRLFDLNAASVQGVGYLRTITFRRGDIQTLFGDNDWGPGIDWLGVRLGISENRVLSCTVKPSTLHEVHKTLLGSPPRSVALLFSFHPTLILS